MALYQNVSFGNEERQSKLWNERCKSQTSISSSAKLDFSIFENDDPERSYNSVTLDSSNPEFKQSEVVCLLQNYIVVEKNEQPE